MVRLFSYLRLTPAAGPPLNLLHPVWTVDNPVYTSSHRDHESATNLGFAVYPLLANAGLVTVQARYNPARALAAGASRQSRWHEDLGAYPGPSRIAAVKGQIVTLEWAGLAAPMFFREARFTPQNYVDSASGDPAGAPLAVDVVMTFKETDPEDRWL